MADVFEGDVLLTDTLDGGLLHLEDGLIVPDKKFTTATYLSLFGGNPNDGGEVDSKDTWWGNKMLGVAGNEKIISRFQKIIRSLPLTGKNVALAEQAVQDDLRWMLDEGIADEIQVDIRELGLHQITVAIQVKKDGQLIEDDAYDVYWEAGANGI